MLMQLPERLREHVDRLKSETADRGRGLHLLDQAEQKPELRALLAPVDAESDPQIERLIERIRAIDKDLGERP